MLILAAIAFGPMGPVERRTLVEPMVRAEIRYRIAHDRQHDTGEGAHVPSIASGTLTFVVSGHRRTYDLAALLPIHDEAILLPTNIHDGCGATRALTRAGHYLAIEATVAEKGCTDMAVFIDMMNGDVAQDVVLDHAWDHRFAVRPERLSGERLSVDRVDVVTLREAAWNALGTTPRIVPWRFAVVHASNAQSRPQLLSFPLAAESGTTDVLPAKGSRIYVGSSDDRFIVRWFDAEELLHLSTADELRYAALQTPTPSDTERVIRRNSWMQEAYDQADHGHFDKAVHAFAMMLTYESNASLAAGESQMLRQCRTMATKVNAGRIRPSAASLTFRNGCELQEPSPAP